MAKEYALPYYETCYGEDEEVLGPRHSALPAAAREGLKRLKTLQETVIPKFISEEQLNKGLDKWLPRPGDPQGEKRVLKDSVFPQISELLKCYGKGEWSLRPRTFAILRMLGCPEALDEFVNLNRKDSSLPYTEGNLPDFIKGSTQAIQVLQAPANGPMQPERHIGSGKGWQAFTPG